MKLQTVHLAVSLVLGLAVLCVGIAFLFPWTDSTPIRSADTPRYVVESTHQSFRFPDPADVREIEFPIYWPPNAAQRSRSPQSLLNGKLHVSIGRRGGDSVLNVHAELSRPAAEPDREYWNRRLAFPEYDWMSRVRVWDADEKWLWPNLPFLLQAHGVAREERYGGVDPGSGVDNDFAAIVLRPIDGQKPLAESVPQISAQWHAPFSEKTHKSSIVHKAVSGDLQITPANAHQTYGVWIIYADFLNSPPPRNWPEEYEFDGGVLAFFKIAIEHDSDQQGSIVEAVHQNPISSTGVDWRDWQARISSP